MNPVIGLCSLIAAVTLPFLAPVPMQQPDDPVAGVRARLVNEINEHRKAAGLGALMLDPLAQRAAQFQAQDMESAGVMRHDDSDGRSPMERYSDLGGHATLYGENVAYYGDSFQETDAVWAAVEKLDAMMMAERPPSDGHRENILSPDYKGIGIGVAIGPNGIYIAEDFVTP
ncbi:MAG TPA: CAP domain-containing protein [Candidatus Acidoferrales bacterium]|nr:CAP domain-containing protein [Candidatus Acidoferrales bacterium]